MLRDGPLGWGLARASAVGGVPVGLITGRGRRPGISLLQPPPEPGQQGAPRLVAPGTRGQLGVRGLADPARCEGAVRAELADAHALPTGRKVRLGTLALQHRPAADVADD